MVIEQPIGCRCLTRLMQLMGRDMKTANVFDLSKLDDIPESIRSDLIVLHIKEFEKNIKDLFSLAGRQLNLDEITVAYFRQYGGNYTRKQMMQKIYNMARASNPFIRAIEDRKGVYEAINQ